MTALQRALTGFFARLGLPVYLADWVPVGAGCPYLTLTLENAGGAQGRLDEAQGQITTSFAR